MKRITYEYYGSILDPERSEWFEGEIVKREYKGTWYDGSEFCPDADVKERVETLKKITNRSYRNIQVIDLTDDDLANEFCQFWNHDKIASKAKQDEENPTASLLSYLEITGSP